MNQPRHRLLLTLLLAASLAAGMAAPALGQQGHNPFVTPEATPEATGAWELIDQRDLAIDGELVALSPDGQWIAGIGPDGNRLCVWSIESGDATCDEERQPIAADSIAWAPDSSAVTFALDVVIRLWDSDIFVFELAAGRSVNLTDDGYDDDLLTAATDAIDPLPVDVYPAWTPDGESLAFARTDVRAEQPTTQLMTIARTGGTPEPLHAVCDDFGFAIMSPIFPLADGSVLYSVAVTFVYEPVNGIWRLDPDGEAVQLMPGARDEALPLATLVDVREEPSGTIVSGYSRTLAEEPPGGEPYAFELDVDRGTVSPVGPSGEPGAFQTAFAYAPDGASTIAFEVSGGERRLVITGADGTRLDLGAFEFGPLANSRGIAWAANDTILVPGVRSGGVLLTVERRP